MESLLPAIVLKHRLLFSLGCDTITIMNGLLVDYGVTIHVVTDESKFISNDNNFHPENQFRELTHIKNPNYSVLKRGMSQITLGDGNKNYAKLYLN